MSKTLRANNVAYIIIKLVLDKGYVENIKIVFNNIRHFFFYWYFTI